MSSSTLSKYHAIIIGSGQAGSPLASAFAKAGQKTALIESTHLGGCCINEGCTPTKTLIASGRVAYLARRGQDYGIHTVSSTAGADKSTNEVIVDMLRVRERKRDIVNQFRGGSERRTKETGVDVLMGTAAFVDAKSVEVKMNDGTAKTISGHKIFINTGERPAPSNLPGIEDIVATRVLDSTSIQELDAIPAHLVVLGGGYVGIEFAQLFRRLGSSVTVIQRGRQLLPREDPEMASGLLQILQEEGLTIHLETAATSIAPSAGGFILQLTSQHSSTSSVTGTHILVATGRIPNTESLCLPRAGIKTTPKGHIVTNTYLETSVPNIYAMGDVKGPPAFTHISYDDFRIIRANHITNLSAEGNMKDGMENKSTTARQNLIPYVVYTDPQLAHIGLHEHEARTLFPGHMVLTASMPMSYVARALETDETRGLMKAVVDGESGLILGFTCLGIEGGEVMSVVQMAMVGRVGWKVLEEAIWAHPALSESLNNLWAYLK